MWQDNERVKLNWLLLTMLFGTFLILIFIALYLILYKGLPGRGWKKGLFFGIVLGAIFDRFGVIEKDEQRMARRIERRSDSMAS